MTITFAAIQIFGTHILATCAFGPSNKAAAAASRGDLDLRGACPAVKVPDCEVCRTNLLGAIHRHAVKHVMVSLFDDILQLRLAVNRVADSLERGVDDVRNSIDLQLGIRDDAVPIRVGSLEALDCICSVD